MEPDEILPALTGELYRYRLAIQDQLRRIAAATDEVRQERTRIEEDEYQLLFAPSMSIEAFTAQLQAIHDRDIPLVWRLKGEGAFILAAVYGVLTMAKGIRRGMGRAHGRHLRLGLGAAVNGETG